MTLAPKLLSSHWKEPDSLEKLLILGLGQTMNLESPEYLVEVESKNAIKELELYQMDLKKQMRQPEH